MPHSTNFLEHIEPEKEQQKHSRKRWVLAGGAVVLFLFVLVVGWTAVIAGRVVTAALDGRDHLLAARDAATNLDFATASTELNAASDRFTIADDGLKALWYVKAIPWVSTQLTASETIVSVGGDLIGVMKDIVDLGQETMRLAGVVTDQVAGVSSGVNTQMSYNDLSPETKRAVLARLAGAAPEFAVEAAKVKLAISELDDLPDNDLVGPIKDALGPARQKLVDVQQTLDLVSTAAVLLPSFGGLTAPSNVLVLFSNNTELRPAGGFIGTYGVMQITDGSVSSLTTKDSYALDGPAAAYVSPAPPAALRTYNATSAWSFRDSNWSPDFAVAAQQAIALFDQEVLALPPDTRAAVQPPVTFTSVVSLTPSFAADLLRITGPITVGTQTFSADNIADTLDYQVEYGYASQGLPPAQRKEIIADLVNEVKDRLFSLPLSQWGSVQTAFEHALTDKQLTFYSADQHTEDVLTTTGWGGRMVPGNNDNLLVVDASLASLKTDPSVDRTIAYSIEPTSDGQFVGKVAITYDHRGTFNWKTTRYRTYTRVYVPDGSTLLRSSGSLKDDKLKNPSLAEGTVDVGTDLGFTTFGAFTSVEPGESRTLTFEYVLPSSVTDAINNGTYQLDVFKQIGAFDHALTLDLDFGKKVASATPAEASTEWGDNRYRLNTILDQDQEVRVNF